MGCDPVPLAGEGYRVDQEPVPLACLRYRFCFSPGTLGPSYITRTPVLPPPLAPLLAIAGASPPPLRSSAAPACTHPAARHRQLLHEARAAGLLRPVARARARAPSSVAAPPPPSSSSTAAPGAPHRRPTPTPARCDRPHADSSAPGRRRLQRPRPYADSSGPRRRRRCRFISRPHRTSPTLHIPCSTSPHASTAPCSTHRPALHWPCSARPAAPR